VTLNLSCFAQVFQFPFFGLTFSQDVNNNIQNDDEYESIKCNNNFTHRFFVKKAPIERCIVGAVEEQKPRVINSSNRNRNRTPSEWRSVDRPDLDDDNATSLKHGNKAFLDYMLNSVFVGSK